MGAAVALRPAATGCLLREAPRPDRPCRPAAEQGTTRAVTASPKDERVIPDRLIPQTSQTQLLSAPSSSLCPEDVEKASEAESE